MPGDSVPYWSFSKLSSYISCSLQFFFKYVAKVQPAFISSNLLLGSGLHFVHEQIYSGMAREQIPILKDVLSAVEEEIRSREKTSPPIKFSNGGDLETLIREAKILTEVLFESVEPEEVVAVDHEEVVQLNDGNGFLASLKVIYDLIVKDGKGREVIVDLKTARTFPEERCKFDLQPSCYLLARKISTGQIPNFRYDVLFKKKAPECDRRPENS